LGGLADKGKHGVQCKEVL